MSGNYNSPKVATYEKEEEISNISKGSSEMTLSNSSSADNENERIRKGLMSTIKAIENVDREYEKKLMREYEIYCQNSLMRK